MKLLVTGSTGFIGRHLVPLLLQSGHVVTVIVRDIERASVYDWFSLVECLEIDIHQDEQISIPQLSGYDALIHLAWQGLPNYNESFHVDSNLPADCRFLKKVIQNGIDHVLVTGTCLEYGMQSGPLSEEMETKPVTAYGLAKDTLRKYLQLLQKQHVFRLQWARLFYMYGEGQNPNSLLAQLQKAIDNGDAVFKMSEGEQLRDYLPVESVVRHLLRLVENPDCDGTINICSGQPISVRRLVENYIADKQTNITPDLGKYPYLEYEPLAFWGCRDKLQQWLNEP